MVREVNSDLIDDDATTAFQKKLIKRGQRQAGTRTCWADRFKENGMKTWYYPFSMAQIPSPRPPGVDLKNMKNLFEKLY